MMESVKSKHSLLPQQLESQGAQRSKPTDKKDGFTSDLAQAQAAGSMVVPQQIPAQKQLSGPDMEAMTKTAGDGNGAIRSNLAQSMAERAPQTQDKAASLNTASVIAGLKPWSKDWVFPEKGISPDMKPLFGASAGDAKASPAEMEQAQLAYASLVAQLGNLKNALGEEAPASATDASSQMAQAQAATAGSTRGDTEAALAAQNAAQAAANLVAKNNGGVSAQMSEPLQQQLRQMGGTLERVNGASNENGNTTRGFGARPQTGKAGAGSVSSLSGGEFLSALTAAKGPRNSGDEAQLGGQGFGENGAQMGLNKPSLRLIDGGSELESKKSFEDSLLASNAGLQVGHRSGQQQQPSFGPTVNVTGHVVKGQMSQDRLSSEALLNIGAGVRNLSSSGGGEMRIKLKPENLGELHVRVVTDGKNVGLQFQASDENAKKILEESMSHLKETLSAQNLSLHSVDVSVAHAAGHAHGGDMRNDQGQQGQNGQQIFHDLLGQNQGHGSFGGNSGGNRWDGDAIGSAPLRSASATRASGVAAASAPARRSVAGGNGRLDVRA